MHGDSSGVSRRLGYALIFASFTSACEPDLVVGSWKCATTPDPAGPHDAGVDGGVLPLTDPVAVPWSTSFEDGFCGYAKARGFCYTNPDASSEITSALAHTGHHSVKFSVTAESGKDGLQARCVREGTLPTDAYYGAWYYVPALATNSGDWNLIHFQTGDQSSLHGLWDVSLGNASDGGLYLYLFDFLRGSQRRPATLTEIPIGAWFHVEFRLVRANDTSGEVALYQDGTLLLDVPGVATDDGQIGQVYVGNLADSITPPASTVYVDDVSISTTL
jgi:hypothetical protein